LQALQHTQGSLAASERALQQNGPGVAPARPQPIAELGALERDIPRHALGARGLSDLGLYEGERVTPPLSRYYQNAFTQAVVRPLLQQNHGTLLARTLELQVSAGARRSQSQGDDARNELRDALGVHLLLTTPRESCTPKPQARQAFILERLLALWERAEPAAATQTSARRQLLERYLELTDLGLSAVSAERDERAVAEARRALGEDDRVERLLRRLIAQHEATPQTLATLAGPSVAIQARASVGGAFNLETWAQLSRSIGAADFRESDGDWVFGCGDSQDDAARAELDSQVFQQSYLKRYAASWQEFVSGLHGQSPRDAAEAEVMLGELVNRTGVLGALFATVHEQTALPVARDPLGARAAESLEQATTREAGPEGIGRGPEGLA
jgi:type VI protein secretion system component VasK